MIVVIARHEAISLNNLPDSFKIKLLIAIEIFR